MILPMLLMIAEQPENQKTSNEIQREAAHLDELDFPKWKHKKCGGKVVRAAATTIEQFYCFNCTHVPLKEIEPAFYNTERP